LLALAGRHLKAGSDWVVRIGDVSTAFLHASIPESRHIVVIPPVGEEEPEYLWRMLKALYGLRESPRLFQEHLAQVTQSRGWTRLRMDPQLYVHLETGAVMSVFADDLLIIMPRAKEEQVRRTLDEKLKIKWGAEIDLTWTRYLGREWCQVARGEFAVRMPLQYWAELLEEAGLRESRALSTPAELGQQNLESEEVLEATEKAQYRRFVGKLLFATQVRPDIAYVAKECARHVQKPTRADMVRLRHLLRYLRGTQDMELHLNVRASMPSPPGELLCLTDANWADGPSRRSTSGGLLVYENVLLLTWSRTQAVVALSSCEAELLALTVALQEAMFVKSVLEELREEAHISVRTDSSSARAVVHRRGAGRLKHIALRELWLQDEYRKGSFELSAIATAANVADLLTKVMAGA